MGNSERLSTHFQDTIASFFKKNTHGVFLSEEKTLLLLLLGS